MPAIPLQERLRRRCEGYPLNKQRNHPDPVLCAKLYWPVGKARWYIAGYSPKTMLAYGFVVGVGKDEWGYFSVASLLETRIGGIMPVKLDENFGPVHASKLGIVHRRLLRIVCGTRAK